MRTRPLRRTTLHLLHRTFTDARTRIASPRSRAATADMDYLKRYVIRPRVKS